MDDDAELEEELHRELEHELIIRPDKDGKDEQVNAVISILFYSECFGCILFLIV